MAWKRHKQYRLPGYDYAAQGAYLITAVCKNRESFLGDIKEGVLTLTQAGLYLESLIEGLEEKISWCTVQEHQIMPNHLHLILLIEENPENQVWLPVRGLQPLRKKSVSSFANHLKGKLRRWCKEQQLTFEWQSRFHDRIIRDQQEYNALKRYVQQNVENWSRDWDILPPE